MEKKCREEGRLEAKGRENVQLGCGQLEPDALGSSSVKGTAELILLDTRLAGWQSVIS